MTTTIEEPWYPDAFLQNEWTFKYRDMMNAAQSENRIKVAGEHSEHHIVPESFFAKRNRQGPLGWLPGNPDDPSNLVILTHREHAQAHIWLWEHMTEGTAKYRMAVPIKMLMRRSKFTDTSCGITVEKLAKIMSDMAMNNRDFTVRDWANRDGRTFNGTRYDLEMWAGLPSGSLMGLTCNSPRKTLRGWWIVLSDKKPPPLRARQHDTIVRDWIHSDGRTFTGTRLDLEEREGLKYRALKHLVGPKARQQSHGWQIVQPEEDTQEGK